MKDMRSTSSLHWINFHASSFRAVKSYITILTFGRRVARPPAVKTADEPMSTTLQNQDLAENRVARERQRQVRVGVEVDHARLNIPIMFGMRCDGPWNSTCDVIKPPSSDAALATRPGIACVAAGGISSRTIRIQSIVLGDSASIFNDCEPVDAVNLEKGMIFDGLSCDAADNIIAHFDLCGQVRVTDAGLCEHQASEGEAVNSVQVGKIDLLRVSSVSSSSTITKGLLTDRVWFCTWDLGDIIGACSSVVRSVMELCEFAPSSRNAFMNVHVKLT